MSPYMDFLILYGILGCIRGPKIDQNEQIHDFWAFFVHLHITKFENKYIFWYYEFMETFERICENTRLG